jgi:Skp family chaperone for outer membrane proteins
MKRSALAGLFVAATLLAPAAFAADDLCAVNLQKIKDAQPQMKVQSVELNARIKQAVENAQKEQAKGTDEGNKNCISLTERALNDIDDTDDGRE